MWAHHHHLKKNAKKGSRLADGDRISGGAGAGAGGGMDGKSDWCGSRACADGTAARTVPLTVGK
jgi:hypothetical protein